MERAYITYRVARAALIILTFLAAVGVAGWVETGGN